MFANDKVNDKVICQCCLWQQMDGGVVAYCHGVSESDCWYSLSLSNVWQPGSRWWTVPGTPLEPMVTSTANTQHSKGSRWSALILWTAKSESRKWMHLFMNSKIWYVFLNSCKSPWTECHLSIPATDAAWQVGFLQHLVFYSRFRHLKFLVH